MIGADVDGEKPDAPPDEWRCAKRIRWWCKAAVIHGAAGEAAHYRNAAIVTEMAKRFVFVEARSEHAAAWAAIIRCPTSLVILPRKGAHPIAPPTKTIQ